MTSENMKTIQAAVAGADDSVLVMVIPTSRINDVFGGSEPIGDPYTPDLKIAEYKAQFEPELSLSRIRELCAEGAFPDSENESGEVVPGAYKNSKDEWQITMAGIVARQRREREEGLKRRKREEERKRLEDDERRAKHEGSTEEDDDAPVTERKRRSKPSSGEPVDRPNKDSWQKILEEKDKAA